MHTPFVRERNSVAPIEMNPSDMEKLGLKAGDLVEVYNDVGSTQAMVYPTPTAKPGQAFMLFIVPTGQVGNVISKGTNEFMILTTRTSGPTSGGSVTCRALTR